ncbi:Uncharacterised protein [Candidatus Venteria ishoeyi]|uniref:Uncharacterized protein n=1 Tax=Candidatus Venteria ishoeyi TaxID=1899563 RepID=A0A1H6FFK9_9GAMM|nr:hypothetical protein [Candidatus Venteria ishoeyi]SEH07825.1 Uncharacterised protein [Candidatus Venteria ishoeyi]
MREPIWILDEIVESIHSMLLAEHGGGCGIRDKSLLDSALARPKQKFSYNSSVSIFDLSAAYSFGIAKKIIRLLMETKEQHLLLVLCFLKLMVLNLMQQKLMLLLPLKI